MQTHIIYTAGFLGREFGSSKSWSFTIFSAQTFMGAHRLFTLLFSGISYNLVILLKGLFSFSVFLDVFYGLSIPRASNNVRGALYSCFTMHRCTKSEMLGKGKGLMGDLCFRQLSGGAEGHCSLSPSPLYYWCPAQNRCAVY